MIEPLSPAKYRPRNIMFSLLVRYAVRNFIRNIKKNIILIITIAAGLLSYIFLNSFMIGITEESKKTVALYENGYITLMNPNYFKSQLYPLEDTLVFSPSQEQFLLEEGWDLSPQLLFGGNVILQSPPFPTSGNLNFSVRAIDFERDTFFQDILEKDIVAGLEDKNMSELIQMLDNEDGVLMSTWMAKRISAELGYTINIISKGRGGFIEQLDLTIVGFFETPDVRIDRGSLLMSYKNASEYLFAEGEYSIVNLIQDINSKLPSEQELRKDIEGIREHVDEGISIYTWREIQESQFGNLTWEMPKGIAFIYTVFIFIIAAVGISNTSYISIITRHKEIATLQAFGLNSAQLIILYTLEMMIVGLVASVLACIFGVGVMALMVYKGIDYSQFMDNSTFGYVMAGVFHGAWDFSSLWKSTILGVSFTLCVECIVMLRAKTQYSNLIDMLRAKT